MAAPRRTFRAQSLLAIAALLSVQLGSARTRADEAQDKSRLFARRTALLIENFTRYIEWPASALQENGPFVLCLQGSSETAEELNRVAGIVKFKKRPTAVRRVRPGDDLGSCHLLYLAPSEKGRLAQIVLALSDHAVLIVSDNPGFVEHGVHFNFFPVVRSSPTPGTYPQFEWSVPAVSRSKLLIAPLLLRQGRGVEPTSSGDGARPPGP